MTAPCDGWVARDIVRHMVEWMPGLIHFRVEQPIDLFCTGDVLVHTWDLARAAGPDESLDPDEVHRMLVGLEPMDEALRASGHYGPRVPVPDDADEQTRLIAFTGRQP